MKDCSKCPLKGSKNCKVTLKKKYTELLNLLNNLKGAYN